jgi:hypothetical protein
MLATFADLPFDVSILGHRRLALDSSRGTEGFALLVSRTLDEERNEKDTEYSGHVRREPGSPTAYFKRL